MGISCFSFDPVRPQEDAAYTSKGIRFGRLRTDSEMQYYLSPSITSFKNESYIVLKAQVYCEIPEHNMWLHA